MHRNLFLAFLTASSLLVFLKQQGTSISMNCDSIYETALTSNNIVDIKFLTNQEDCINNSLINNESCWEEGDLLSQKKYCLSESNTFYQ